MAISKRDVEYNAHLARLELTEKEKERFAMQLSSILGYFNKLGELDLKEIELVYQVTGQENVTREDEIKNTDNHEELLKNVPDRDGNFIKVKSVF